jgi:putative DNA primase/helicase
VRPAACVGLDAALRLYHAGLSVLRVRADGSKQPLGPWKPYQTQAATEALVRSWFRDGRDGIGAAMGTASGTCELFEFDDAATYQAFTEAAAAAGLGELVARIAQGYSEATPGGGGHWFYRGAEGSGSTKLARRPQPNAADPRAVKTLIETKGQGGFAVMAPSGGTTHPSGRCYRVLAGSVETIARITPEERRDLWALARTFDQMPLAQEQRRRPHRPAVPGASLSSPGDDLNNQANWAEILGSHGWAHVHRQGQTDYWRRPGKARGISATTNHTGRDTLIVFSTSTPFETQPSSYSKFGAFTLLNFGGDFRAAANALRLEGLGWA